MNESKELKEATLIINKMNKLKKLASEKAKRLAVFGINQEDIEEDKLSRIIFGKHAACPSYPNCDIDSMGCCYQTSEEDLE